MDSWLLIGRIISFGILFATIAGARAQNGSSVANIPYWIALGMLLLYVSYCMSGIEFSNGNSVYAELALAGLPAVSAIGFGFATHRGMSACLRPRKLAPTIAAPIPKISGAYIVAALTLAIIFFTTLTGGQPWRVFTDGVEWKWERLNAAADKDARLLLLDAMVFASILIGLTWSIVGYRDDQRSLKCLLVFLSLTLLYVLSTGSRTPLIAVILQIVSSVIYGQRHSRFVRTLSANSLVISGSVAAVVAFMITVTASRVQFEELSSSVFEIYFDINKLGVIDWLTERGAAGFFAATLITYAASTYNNAVIRIQELDTITLSFGYKFAFFYLSGLESLTAGVFTEVIAKWRGLATINNEQLLVISPSATQWATLFGDAIWDFGLVASGMLVLVVSYAAGRVIKRASMRPSLSSYLLAATLIGFSLSPLVNPFLSLHVHFMFFIVAAIHLVTRRQRRSKHLGVNVPLSSNPGGAK